LRRDCTEGRCRGVYLSRGKKKMRRKTHILVVDEEGIVRDGLCALLQCAEELHVDGAFSSAREAVRTRGDLRPSVVIMDFPLAMKTGPETIAHVKRRWPEARVLVLCGSSEGQVIEAARRAGADGYVLRNDRRSELFDAIHSLASGKHYISKSVLEPPARSNGPPSPHAPRRTDTAGMLTEREQEVVALIAEGYRTREMAQLLSVSHKTVERHRTNLMRKLGVRSATGVVAYAITHRYVGF
jgi:two-component system, NarL family, response regulator NreC